MGSGKKAQNAQAQSRSFRVLCGMHECVSASAYRYACVCVKPTSGVFPNCSPPHLLKLEVYQLQLIYLASLPSLNVGSRGLNPCLHACTARTGPTESPP